MRAELARGQSSQPVAFRRVHFAAFATDLGWRQGLWGSRSRAGTSPSVARLGVAGIVDGALAFAALDLAHRASGLGSILAAVDAPSGSPPTAVQKRRRRDGLVAGALWVTVVACADTRAGRTPGRALAGIRLERRDGKPLTPARIIVRQWTPTARRLALRALWPHIPPKARPAAWLGSLGVAFAFLAVPTAEGERRSMGDWVAGTRLVGG